MKIRNITYAVGLLGMMMAIMLGGCATPKKITYFQDIDSMEVDEIATKTPILVRPGDKLSIIVSSKDPELANLFNLPVISNRLGTYQGLQQGSQAYRGYAGSSDGMSYYTVTPEGTIDFPVLGMLKIVGMSRPEVAGFIKGELQGRNLVNDAVVSVEFINVGVNILGEVKNPGRYDINKDEMTVTEALAMAGDLTINGVRDNVLVMREENGKMHSYRLDLTNGKQMLASPGYYLQQNDMIYVEPNGQKKRSSTVNGNSALSTSFWVSVGSLLTSICVLIFK